MIDAHLRSTSTGINLLKYAPGIDTYEMAKTVQQAEELGGIIMLLHDFTLEDMNKYLFTPE